MKKCPDGRCSNWYCGETGECPCKLNCHRHVSKAQLVNMCEKLGLYREGTKEELAQRISVHEDEAGGEEGVIPESAFTISTHLLIRGERIAVGWWTAGNGNSMPIEKMADSHLKNAAAYLKRKILDGLDSTENEYPFQWICMNAFMLEQLSQEGFMRKYRARGNRTAHDDKYDRIFATLGSVEQW